MSPELPSQDVSLAVCNLTVRGLHTFAVGDAQILVHNVSGSVPSGNPVPIENEIAYANAQINALNASIARNEAAYAAAGDYDARMVAYRALESAGTLLEKYQGWVSFLKTL